jgi:molybdopterin/thiamine biosynthesis adenylyltransferase/rhodanese-related sulfurtransferase
MDVDVIKRYSRQIVLEEVGREGQRKIMQSSVLVVGAGGLGSPAVQYLASAGIGRIGIVDDDVVELHNLPRQILFGENDLGKNKALAAAQIVASKNSGCEVQPYPTRLSAMNIREIIHDYDIVLDCTDNFPSRYLINDACKLSGKVAVHGALYRFEGQIILIDHVQSATTYRSVFPESMNKENVLACSVEGMLGMISGTVGTMMAGEALKKLLEIADGLKIRFHCIDLKAMSLSSISVERDEIAESAAPSTWDHFLLHHIAQVNTVDEIDIDVDTLLLNPQTECLLDVREPFEREEFPLAGALTSTLYELVSNPPDLVLSQKIIVVCTNGVRSRIGARLLRDKLGIETVYSLRDGYQSLISRLNKVK